MLKQLLSLITLVCLLGTTQSDILGCWTTDNTADTSVTFLTDGTFVSHQKDKRTNVDKERTGPYTLSENGSTISTTADGRNYTGNLEWIDRDTVKVTYHVLFFSRSITWHRMTDSTEKIAQHQ